MKTLPTLMAATVLAGMSVFIHATAALADAIEDQLKVCQEGTWESLGFESQGACVGLVASGQVLVWDLFGDFLLFPDQENPNRDRNGNLEVWHFLSSTGLDHDPATYVLLPNFRIVFDGAREQWDDGNAASFFTPLVGVQKFLEVGIMHPTDTQLAIVSWQSPINGIVSISGEFLDRDPGGGDGIVWSVDHDTTPGVVTLAEGTIKGPPAAFSDNFGFNLTVPVAEGDFLDFIVDPGPGGFGFDTTVFDVTIVGPMPMD